MVLTTAQNSYNKITQIKRCTEPTANLKKIQDALNQIKPKPFKQIKFVVHKANDPSNPVPTGYQYYTASDGNSSTRLVQGVQVPM